MDDQYVDGHPWSAVDAIGLPFHGLAADGTLSLSVGGSIPCPTPTRFDAFKVQRPGWTAPARSPEQLVHDAENGFEWRDYALISGGVDYPGIVDFYIGGYSIGGWIWFDADGAAWRVKVESWGDDYSALAMSLSFTRFGLFNETPPPVEYKTVPTFDAGQSTALRVRNSSGGSLTALSSSGLRRRLAGLSSDGSKSLWEIYAVHYSKPNLYPTVMERIVGVYELTINTDKSVTPSVIATRAQCVGTVDQWDDWVWPAGTPGYNAAMGVYVETPPDYITSCAIGEPRSTTRTASIAEVGSGAGDLIFSAQYEADYMATRSVKDIVVGAYYKGGVVELAKLRAGGMHSRSTDCDLSLTVSSQTRSCDGSTMTVHETDDIAWELSCTTTETSSAWSTISFGSTEVTDSYSATDTVVMFGPAPTEGFTDWGQVTQNKTVTHGGDVFTYPELTGRVALHGTPGAANVYLYGYGTGSVGAWYSSASVDDPLDWLPFGPTMGPTNHHSFCRWGAGIISPLRVFGSSWALGSPGAMDRWAVGEAYSQGNEVIGTGVTFAPISGRYEPRMIVASHQPVTGEWHGVAPYAGTTAFAWV